MRIYFVIASALVMGFIFEPLGQLKPIVPFIIGVVLFLSFIDLQLRLKNLIRLELLVTLTLSALIMPALAYFVFSNGLKPLYRIGLLLVALAPSGIIMLILSAYVEEKDTGLIISNFFATLFGAIIYMPLVLKWFIGAEVQINSLKLLWQAALLVLLPYGLAQIARRNYVFCQSLRTIKGYFIPGAIFFIISISLANAKAKLFWHNDLIQVIGAVFCIYLVQGGLGFILGKLFWQTSQRNTLALVASSRNIQFVLAVAILNFDPIIIVPLIIGILFHHLTNLIWLFLLASKPKPAQSISQ